MTNQNNSQTDNTEFIIDSYFTLERHDHPNTLQPKSSSFFNMNEVTHYIIQMQFGDQSEKIDATKMLRNFNFIIAYNIWIYLNDEEDKDNNWKMIIAFDEDEKDIASKQLHISNHEYKVTKHKIVTALTQPAIKVSDWCSNKMESWRSESTFGFKIQHTFEKRKAESDRILQKYPDRIPVICEPVPNSNIQARNIKKKYLVPSDLTFGQLTYVIRKRLQMEPERSLYLFVANRFPGTGAIVSDLYANLKDEDGFLYVRFTEPFIS